MDKDIPVITFDADLENPEMIYWHPMLEQTTFLPEAESKNVLRSEMGEKGITGGSILCLFVDVAQPAMIDREGMKRRPFEKLYRHQMLKLQILAKQSKIMINLLNLKTILEG